MKTAELIKSWQAEVDRLHDTKPNTDQYGYRSAIEKCISDLQSCASQPQGMSAEQVEGCCSLELCSSRKRLSVQCIKPNDCQFPAASPSVKADGWVSVEEGLPLTGKRVLCITTSGFISVGYNYRDVWEMNDCGESFASRGYTVTHWHPIPAPPNVNNK